MSIYGAMAVTPSNGVAREGYMTAGRRWMVYATAARSRLAVARIASLSYDHFCLPWHCLQAIAQQAMI